MFILYFRIVPYVIGLTRTDPNVRLPSCQRFCKRTPFKLNHSSHPHHNDDDGQNGRTPTNGESFAQPLTGSMFCNPTYKLYYVWALSPPSLSEWQCFFLLLLAQVFSCVFFFFNIFRVTSSPLPMLRSVVIINLSLPSTYTWFYGVDFFLL